MERTVITISENGIVDILSGNIWISEPELVELFGVIAPTLRATIRAIYKSGTLNPANTRRCETISYARRATLYNLEMIIALAFRLNSYEASRIREKVLERVCQQKENATCVFISFSNNIHTAIS